ncbi:putative transmembrane serine/threonine-protein kinase I PknI (protein kinase I) (STPK I) (phosphorylase B kinase kinase) (hydroxyalkyl-protein kinase) [Mycobacterium tuberculosis H37Rv] [Mycobacterium shimoidei]|uniref:Putative transmembrane serine/threonine-protein kinase I PknI (Protein kinase I) (STPK I) (Phosphorylase B kinase kinase) (Hydroxyalkyl-protein kinase) [Mycobacterium tuberculosis H37Rv] n=1 Tax=Mycobacterium shimoidei TaxID=29313 RepID=A0A375YXR2_MYCSH|nr:hypothetical protein [Mycobacterium shimoidei]SRX93545.1 putative transmembrane serine/threonine-protein kinase I PknI (protein kinase I) (STPK I) (phosphorylase B kinase kinase) (hydroxyalkyl-protein kinase) [Mycobacterium tuberculosis H37Rv] [Mycobacterium shimoidei]
MTAQGHTDDDEPATVAGDAAVTDDPDDALTVIAETGEITRPPLAYELEDPTASDQESIGLHRRRMTPGRITALAVVASVVVAVVAGAVAFLSLRGDHTPAPKPAAAQTPPPPPKPLLNGTYRIDQDWEHSTFSSTNVEGGVRWEDADQSRVYWWAFTSTCADEGCIATVTTLDDKDHQQVVMPRATVAMRFTNGVWQVITPVNAQYPCARVDGSKTGGAYWTSLTWSLKPQPNGTFHGDSVTSIVTDECGTKGNTLTTPITATRVGDVPPSVLGDAAPPPTAAAPAPAPAAPTPHAAPTPRHVGADAQFLDAMRSKGIPMPASGDAGANRDGALGV